MHHLFKFLVLSLLILYASCKQERSMFEQLSGEKTGITFRNNITESDSLNIMQDEFIYNGGGVGIGDFNGDGLPDVYFTGSQVENRLYLNRGNLHFEDITQTSGAQKLPGMWSSGVNVLDINRDGKADIYVCNTFVKDPEKRKNLLFVNQGNDSNGIPHFAEMAGQFGIADTTHSSHAQFFDSDNDGDLDLFIGVNVMDTKIPNRYITKVTDGSAQNCDKLYRNEAGKFSDVSLAAGMNYAGFSHSTLTADFNRDGWQDIYVANDYVSNDLLYINQQNGRVENRISQMFKHQAASAMGSDLGDINNDGLADVFTTEMLPYYNKRKKLFLSANNYSTYINNEQYGYEYQYGRNVFQLNRGFDPQTGLPVFSDIAFQTGTQETEWSWAPLLADFDNDGNRDLFVTNGFPRDVTDHDFSLFFSSERYLIPPMDLQEKIPQVKSPKFLFLNKGNLQFENASEKAGVAVPAFSNGAVYADLDLDGDLDIIVNNIDDEAFVFKNTSNDGENKPNYLRVKLQGRPENPDAFGAEITAYFNGQAHLALVLSNRGYLSCPEQTTHFGLGNSTFVDSLVVRWGGGEQTTIRKTPANQVLTIHYTDHPKIPVVPSREPTDFTSADLAALGLDYLSDEYDFIDFNTQPTLPHKFTHCGPALTVGDVNGDQLEDLFIGGSAQRHATLYLQQKQGGFARQSLALKTEPNLQEEDLGSMLFDADSDGDMDLFIARGSPQQHPKWPYYQDVLFVNDGQGHFTAASGAIPSETASNQTAKAADFDGDGDLDLFVGGRMLPKNYPQADKSFLLRNDTKAGGSPLFTDVTAQWCPEMSKIGLVGDALWTDFNQDNRPDLILAGEWMPLVFFENRGNTFERLNAPFSQKTEPLGWWTSLCAADFDNDGDMDYVAGNFGQNTYFQCSTAEPLRVYAKDFDKNGVYDPFISCYWLDSLGKRREYLYNTRDDLLKQLISIRKKFNTYGQLGQATVQEVFPAEALKDAQILSANYMSSSYVENLGAGKFKLSPLPALAQVAPVYGMLPLDVNDDGLLDLIMVGNEYGMELMQGRADAFYGLVLMNQGQGNFQPREIGQSGFFVPGDARALTRMQLADGRQLILASQNTGPMKGFFPADPLRQVVQIATNEVYADIRFSDGRRRRHEFYRGCGFLAQGSRTLLLPKGQGEVVIFDHAGRETRRLPIPPPNTHF